MKVSLNDIVQMLADRVGQPFSIPLQEQLKVILNYKRADWFQKVVDARPDQRRYYLKDFTVELTTVDKADCPVDTDCDVKRTVLPIPVPIRSTYSMYDFVGSADKTVSYRYMTPDQVVIMNKYNRYTNDQTSYFYVDGYIYIYNNLDVDYISVRGIFPDPRVLTPFKCEGVACYTDDDKYELPEDILNSMIQDILRNELRLLSQEQGETETTS